MNIAPTAKKPTGLNMIEFKILKRSKKSRARLGLLKTAHGEVETPSLVPVATQAAVKTLTSEEAVKAGCQILIANTFHLHLKPGEKIIKSGGGIHKFMNWPHPLMTDSGGFQVFSLGFGKDTGVGKIVRDRISNKIEKGDKSKGVKITDKGAWFRSPLDGSKLFLGPEESMKIQQAIGADIMFSFDECTSPLATRGYIEKSLERTHRWAQICLKENEKPPSPRLRRSKQALFGIVQGSYYKDLRRRSAEFINSLGFDGFGIGGDLGKTKTDSRNILRWTIPYLDKNKPRHLLGIGHPEDIEPIIKEGIDTFDCIAPTHYGRRGIAFVKNGRLNLNQSKFLRDKKPLDSNCDCFVCRNYKRNYICHLFRAKEITAMSLLTFHNLHFFNNYVAGVRKKIRQEKI